MALHNMGIQHMSRTNEAGVQAPHNACCWTAGETGTGSYESSVHFWLAKHCLLVLHLLCNLESSEARGVEKVQVEACPRLATEAEDSLSQASLGQLVEDTSTCAHDSTPGNLQVWDAAEPVLWNAQIS
jgi:hypothetical protein